jgi:hypothetical protein
MFSHFYIFPHGQYNNAVFGSPSQTVTVLSEKSDKKHINRKIKQSVFLPSDIPFYKITRSCNLTDEHDGDFLPWCQQL